MNDENESAATASVYRKVLWRILPFLILCYVVAFVDRTNVGIAKLGFVRDLHFSEAIYGLGAGIFYLGYVLLEIPSNLYLVRVGARRTLLRIMVLWGACCAALALISTPSEYYILRLLLGAAEAGLFPGILLYITFWIPAPRRARFTALFMAAIPLAGVIGSPLAGWIMHAFAGWHGLKGWQWLFILEGTPAILLGIVAYLYLDDTPASSKWLSEREKSLLLRDLEEDRRGGAAESEASLAEVLRSPKFYQIAVMGSALMISTSGAFLWLPTIIHNAGVKNIVDVGLLSAIPFVVGIVAQFAVAWNSDRLLERRWHVAVPALIGAVGWGLLPFAAADPKASLLLETVAISGTFGAMGPFWTLPSLMLSRQAVAGGIALVTTIAGFGNFVSPILVGEVTTVSGSLAMGQIYFAIMLVIGVALLFMGGGAPSPVQTKKTALYGT